MAAVRSWRERVIGTPLHDLAGIWMLFWAYAPIIAAYALFHRWPSIPTGIFAAVVAGIRMNAVFVVVHEAFHYNLFRNRKLNVWLGGALASYPIMLPFFHNRDGHWNHHRFVGTAKDPDAGSWDWPDAQRGLFARQMLALASGWIYADKIVRLSFGLPPAVSAAGRPAAPPLSGEKKKAEIARLVVAQLGVLGLFSVTLGPVWYVPLWLIPALSISRACMTLREFLEHRRGALIVYRANPIERFMLGSFNFHLHAYHHAHASAPWFALPALEERARSKVPDIVFLNSYFAELWAFARGRSRVPSRGAERGPMPAGDGSAEERTDPRAA